MAPFRGGCAPRWFRNFIPDARRFSQGGTGLTGLACRCYHAGVPDGETEREGSGEPVLRRVGVIGDVHARDAALEAALGFLRGLGDLNALLCTGDIVDGEGDADRCCALLREAGALTVRGNHDRWFLETVAHRTPGHPHYALSLSACAFLAALPPTRRFRTPRGALLLCHGLGADDMAGIYPDGSGVTPEANHRLHALVGAAEFRFVLCGHTHRPMIRVFEDLTLINAGTLQWGYERGFLVADFERGVAQFYALADDLAIRRAETVPLPAIPDPAFTEEF